MGLYEEYLVDTSHLCHYTEQNKEVAPNFHVELVNLTVAQQER